MANLQQTEDFDLKTFQDRVLQQVERLELSQYGTLVQPDFEADAAMLEANVVAEREDVRGYICPSLNSVVDNVYEIAKAVTPTLAGAVIAGTVIIPLVPALFAGIAFFIARATVKGYCSGYDKTEKA